MKEISSIIFSIFLSSLLFSCQGEPHVMNDWKQLNLKGSVKEAEERIYNNYSDLIAKKEGIRVRTRFKEDGMIYDLTTKFPNGYLRGMRYHYSQDSAIATEYGMQGNRKVSEGKWIYILGTHNHQKTVTHFLASGDLDYAMQMTNNNDGYNTAIKYREDRETKEQPCLVERIFDEQNFLVEERVFFYDETMQTCQEKPKIIKMKNNENGDLSREKLIDEQGNLMVERAYLYKYDEQGNWIEKQIYKNDEIQQTVLRSLVYYE